MRQVARFLVVSLCVSLLVGCGSDEVGDLFGDHAPLPAPAPDPVPDPDPLPFDPAANPPQQLPPNPATLNVNQAPDLFGLENGQPEPRPLLSDEDLDLLREDLSQQEAAAQLLANDYLVANGFGPEDTLALVGGEADPYGRVHVSFQQMHRGVEVVGATLIVHLPEQEAPAEYADNLVEGLDVDPTPVVSQREAELTALAQFAARPGTAPVVDCKMVIDPDLQLMHATGGRLPPAGATREEFDLQLMGATLAYEITVTEALQSLTLEAIQAAIMRSPVTTSSPQDEIEREDGRTVGGNELEVLLDQPPPANPMSENEPTTYLVDATSGAIVDERSLLIQEGLDDFVTPSEGTGYSYFYGEVDLRTSRINGTNLDVLLDRKHVEKWFQVGNLVWDAYSSDTHDRDQMDWFVDDDLNWGDSKINDSENASGARRQTPAVDVAFAMQRTFDFFKNVVQRKGVDKNGEGQCACVHWDVDYGDAHFNGASGLICFGNGSDPDAPGNYYINTVAHEVGHNYWSQENLKTNTRVARALNEGQGDILGSFAQLYHSGARGTGLFVHRVPQDGFWSGRIVSPETYRERNNYVKGCDVLPADLDLDLLPPQCLAWGYRYWDIAIHDDPEHVGGLPFARAVMHLAEGSSSNPDSGYYTQFFPDGMAGIGATKAAKIWNQAMSYHVAGSLDYVDIREGFIAAAEWIYGSGSMEARATMNAFRAIGVGAGANGNEDPQITYRNIFDINTTDMTAKVYLQTEDDQGVREITMSGAGNTGRLRPSHFLGYVDLNGASVGHNAITFTATDGDGNTAVSAKGFTLPHYRQLLSNGGFETDNSGWPSDSGDDHIYFNNDLNDFAFCGRGWLAMSGDDTVWQTVSLPGNASSITFSYRAYVRDTTQGDDIMEVLLEQGGDTTVLATYDKNTPKLHRNLIDRGWVRYEFDLTPWRGRAVRIGFRNDTDHYDDPVFRFGIDQAAVTWEPNVTAGLPKVTLMEEDDTVAFQLPDLAGVPASEISRVDYWVDGEYFVSSVWPSQDWYAARTLSFLSPQTHAVQAIVRGLDFQPIIETQWVAFTPQPVNELLSNGGFEQGFGAWQFQSGSPNNYSVEDDAELVDVIRAYQGGKFLELRPTGEEGEVSVAQQVAVPISIWEAKFVARIEVLPGDPDAPHFDRDDLYLDIIRLDQGEFQMQTLPLAAEHSSQVYDEIGEEHLWRDYFRVEFQLNENYIRGRNILIRLRAKNEGPAGTRFRIDNCSLSHKPLGLMGP